MNTGIFWHDTSLISLALKIRKAIAYYHNRYGRKPQLCLVNPTMTGPDAAPMNLEGLTVRQYQSLPPGHFWIGIEEMPTSMKQENPT